MARFLVALDYDQTIKETATAASKFWMSSLFPDSSVPDELRRVQREDGWDAFYRRCFRYLYKVGRFLGSGRTRERKFETKSDSLAIFNC